MAAEIPNSALQKVEQAVRVIIEKGGLDSLIVDRLRHEDLKHIAWAGGPFHSFSVEEALERSNKGEVDYLAVRSPDGLPVSIGGIDYARYEDAGYMWQLATMPGLRSLGIGTKLIKQMEEYIMKRGLLVAMLGVEDDNQQAQALYERLGYTVCGHERQSWEELDDSLNPYTHQAKVTLMRKNIK